ncbi:MAG: restriction endonuclease subunit R, partial [Microbacteriaceae bacterium]|nr:restriction endonuclease subunit R [Microbacteriaceae bacterium]
ALKRSVQLRYQETVDLSDFEPKIRTLLDNHVVALPAETVVRLVNINDPDALAAVITESGVSEASRADRISSATRRVITERLDEDPALYRRFSELLEETILAFRQRRISEQEYLRKAFELAGKVASKDRGAAVPAAIAENTDAQAVFGVVEDILASPAEKSSIIDPMEIDSDMLATISLEILALITGKLIVGLWSNEVAQNALKNALDDYFIDELRDSAGLELPFEVIDRLQQDLMTLARARFPQ